MKRLVELDPFSMTSKEFDCLKIRRSGERLKQYLSNMHPDEDPYRMKELVLPIVDQALLGTMELPFDLRRKPLSHESSEGLLPAEYARLSAPFFVSISGMSGLGRDLIRPIYVDDKPFAWMEFEDMED